MNYYEHHLGDYLRDTAHLSMLEDGAYRRLIDAYYIREAPLPNALRDVCRLVRAQTKQDREAVETALREFFAESPDGWRHRRCEREIERYQDKQRKAKASAAARWERKPQHSEGNANASPDAMRTHSEGNALQTPDTRQKKERAEDLAAPPARAHEAATPDPDPPTDPPPDPTAAGHPPTPAGSVCRAMRQAGLVAAVNPGDPRLLALLAQGATEAEFVGLAAEAAAKRKGWAWVLVALQERRKDAAAIALASRPPPTVPSDAAERTAAMLASQRLTPQEMVASAEARKRVMAAVSTIGRAAA